MLEDPNADVRQRVLTTLWEPQYRLDPGVLLPAIRHAASSDPSGYVRAEAQRFLDGIAEMAKVVARMEALPDDVRAKVERHRGPWVAVADGRIISADRHRGQVRRDMRGKARPDATVLYVPDA